MRRGLTYQLILELWILLARRKAFEGNGALQVLGEQFHARHYAACSKISVALKQHCRVFPISALDDRSEIQKAHVLKTALEWETMVRARDVFVGPALTDFWRQSMASLDRNHKGHHLGAVRRSLSGVLESDRPLKKLEAEAERMPAVAVKRVSRPTK